MPDIIRRLLHIPPEEINGILYELSDRSYIRPHALFPEKIVIGGHAIELAKSLIKINNLSVLQFKSAQYIPPANKMVFGFQYHYELISPDGNRQSRVVGVFVSDIVAMTTRLSFDKDQSGERLLLQYAKDWVAQKILEESLTEYEERIILTKDLENLPKYNPDDLVSISEAEYIMDPPTKPIMEEIISNQLAPLLIETRDAVNALFYNLP